MDRRQRSPRTPGAREPAGVTDRVAGSRSALDRPPQTEVRSRERVRFAQAERDVVRGPRTETGQGGERCHKWVEAGTTIELDLVLGNGRGEAAYRRCARG